LDVVKFEGLKIAQNIARSYLTFYVHPDDVGNLIEFYKQKVGSRYMVAMALIGDNEEVTPLADKSEARKSYETFCSLCRNERFQLWLHNEQYSAKVDEESAVHGLKKYLGIDSRGELLQNFHAREKFKNIRWLFKQSLRGQ